MKQVITYTAATILIASLAGCASYGSGSSADADYQQAMAEAKVSLKHAARTNFEWRDSGKLLKQAEKAAKDGDYETAIKLANNAKMQGEMAVAQSQDQANAGPPR